MKNKLIKTIDSFFELEHLEPNSIKNRFLKILFCIVMFFLIILVFSCVLGYFFFGIFILDWIYWLFSGKTVLWKTLMN